MAKVLAASVYREYLIARLELGNGEHVSFDYKISRIDEGRVSKTSFKGEFYLT